MSYAYYGHYLTWFEVARSAYLSSLGYSYRELEQNEGIRLAVIEAQVRYRSPAFYDDELSIQTQITQMKKLKIHFEYEIRREKDLIATGSTLLGCLDVNGKPKPFPSDIAQVVRAKIT